MSIAKLIFGFDKKDLEEVKGRLSKLENENNKLWRGLYTVEKEVDTVKLHIKELYSQLSVLSQKTDNIILEGDNLKQELEKAEEKLKLLESELEELRTEISEIIEPTQEVEQEEEQMEELVLNYIAQGISSPKELVEATGLNRNKLYNILNKLLEKGIITKQKEGRRVHYYLVENASPPPATAET